MKKSLITRILALCLALIMVLGLAACGKAPAENAEIPAAEGEKAPEAGGETAAEGAEEKEEITLTVWVQSLVSSAELLLPEEEWWISKAIAKFQEDYPYVNIDLTKQNSGSEAATMFRAGATSGTAPDIAEFWSGSWMTDLADYAYPVDELLSEEAQARLMSWEACAMDFNSDNERIAIPTSSQSIGGFYYNKDIIAEAGLDFENDPPQTVEELFEACEKIKEAGYTPIISDEGSGHNLIYFVFCYWWVQQSGYDTLVAQNKGESKYADDEGLIRAMELYQELYTNGYVNSDAVSASDAESRFMMGTEAAMYPKSSATEAALYEALGDSLGFIKPCDVDPNGIITDKLIGGNGQAFIVSKDTQYPEECAALIEYLVSAEEFIEYKKVRTAAIPNITDVDLSALGELDPVAEKMMGLASEATFYVDNVVDADVIAELVRYSADLLVGNMSPEEVAEAMDAIIAAK